MAKYKVKQGCSPHSRKENGKKVTYQPGGESFTPTENELKYMGDKLEKVESEEKPKENTQEEQSEAETERSEKQKSKGKKG